MEIFDKDGMMIFPNPIRKEIRENQHVLAVKECFCPNGHSLMSSRALFNGIAGIMLKVKLRNKKGLVALSPVYGDKSKISIDIDLVDKELLELSCPKCSAALPTYSKCICGADKVALFLNRKIDFNDCIGICTRVNCFNSEIKSSNDLLTEAGLQTL